ncbi:MAG: divalent metal cation transporter [Bacteroidetes bacterium]|nr:divalent metal cation transporter [Bacteroidota bacterium]
MKRLRFKLGTSSLVVAAFVGPGTVLTCATAGIEFGYALIWVLFFSVAATFILQSFTAGAGILSGLGMGEALRQYTQDSSTRWLIISLVVLGLWAGTAAFETGNIVGAVSGIRTMIGFDKSLLVLSVGGLSGLVLLLDLRNVTRVLAGLVTLMGGIFLIGIIFIPVDWGLAFKGFLVPSIPDGALIKTIALVGTTVVTYNLFLHGSAAKEYWRGANRQFAWRRELTGMAIFLPLGGIISAAILIAGAALDTDTISSVGDISAVIRPVAGPFAEIMFGVGLFAAGITSAVTAPLAAACGIRELFGWPDDRGHIGFRIVWISVLVTGMTFALLERNPLEIIITAQAANGLLLPLIAGFVLYLSVRQDAVQLPRWYFGLGVLVTLICLGLGIRTLLWVTQQIL